jgi:chromosome partitioning protein
VFPNGSRSQGFALHSLTNDGIIEPDVLRIRGNAHRSEVTMPIIAILNQKGGVAKTTTAVTLGAGLALRGHRTLLIDLDSQGNVSDALGIKKGPGLYQLIVGKKPWRELVIPSGLVESRRLLDLLPGDKTTVEAKIYLTTQSFREQTLRRAFDSIGDVYEFVILDLAPSVDVLHVGALVASDAFLVVTRLDHLAVVGVNDALLTLVALKDQGAGFPELLGILPTFWDRTTKESEHQLSALAKTFGTRLWPPIPLDVKAREAPAYGQTLWEYAPRCRALAGAEIGERHIGGYGQALERLLDQAGESGRYPSKHRIVSP